MINDFLEVEQTFMVFYDCEPRLSGNDAMLLINSVADLIRQRPTNAHVAVAGKEKRPLYNHALKQAAEGKFDGYDYLQAVRYVEKGDVSSLTMSIGSDYGELWRGNYKSTFEVGFVEHPDQRFEPRDIIRLLASYQKPSSGIYYRMPFKWGPGWFGSTVINLGLPKIFQDRQREFVEEYREGRQRQGKIRDLFRHNVLTSIHLEARIDGGTLRAWIEGGARVRLRDFLGEHEACWRKLSKGYGSGRSLKKK